MVTDSRAQYKPILKIDCGACGNENVKYSYILDANRNVFRAVLKLFTDEELRMDGAR